ncbi:MAG: magnesium transporter CorA family protein [Fusobacteriales bacterium]|jgi:magnesium transporter|nr:magnesium transporter CorA family protein [Fusobacteriales bacterium]
MLRYYRLNGHVKEIKNSAEYEEADLIKVLDPQYEDIYKISKKERIIHEYLKDSLDKNEIPRLENYKNQLFLLIRVPTEADDKPGNLTFKTTPMGIILTPEKLILIASEDMNIIDVVINNYGKKFESIRSFVMIVLLATTKRYLKYLKTLNINIIGAEARLRKTQSNQELINLMEIEKSLVYFTTSLKGNQMVMERLLSGKLWENDEEKEFIRDVIIENNQALEMSRLYSSIVDSLTSAFSSIISNNLNIVMKALAALTIILNFPMLVSSVYGMNVSLPFQNQKYAFIIVIVISIVLTMISTWYLIKRKWF